MSVTSPVAENALETALRLAASDPAQRPGFYKLLVESTVYILADSNDGATGEKTLNAGDTVRIQKWGRNDGSLVIPFFSSLDVLQKSIDEQINFMAMPARSLFEMTLGAALVMNPRSPYGREFLASEIESLLQTGVNQTPTTRVTTKPFYRRTLGKRLKSWFGK